MTNSPAVEALSLVNQETYAEGKKEKPRLKVLPNPENPPEVGELLRMYQGQARECWLCKKIAADVEQSKKVSEDDQWHFTSCVLSWENLQDLP